MKNVVIGDVPVGCCVPFIFIRFLFLIGPQSQAALLRSGSRTTRPKQSRGPSASNPPSQASATSFRPVSSRCMNIENLSKPAGFGATLTQSALALPRCPRASPLTQARCFAVHCTLVLRCAADPFENAQDDVDQSSDIHIRVQQRNGRKCITTVQGLDAALDLKKVLKVIKKVRACVR